MPSHFMTPISLHNNFCDRVKQRRLVRLITRKHYCSLVLWAIVTLPSSFCNIHRRHFVIIYFESDCATHKSKNFIILDSSGFANKALAIGRFVYEQCTTVNNVMCVKKRCPTFFAVWIMLICA